MDSIIISNVDDDLKQRLIVRAAQHGHSIEAEACDLKAALIGSDKPALSLGNLGDAIRDIVVPLGGIELQIEPRKPVRASPMFE